MGLALIVELLGALIALAMFPQPGRQRHQTAGETTAQRIGRSVRVWLGVALVGKGRLRGRHSIEWRRPAGQRNQVRAIYA